MTEADKKALIAAVLAGETDDDRDQEPLVRFNRAVYRKFTGSEGVFLTDDEIIVLRALFNLPPAAHLTPSEPEVEPPTEGRKDDTGKTPYDLLAPELLEEVVKVLAFGAAKYSTATETGARNWEKGMRWGRPFAAMMRHMWAWWRGEDKDAETGLSHLAHACCCAMFLLAYEQRGIGEDDRPK